MSSVSNNISTFLHTYEAYRIPKGHEALNAKNAELIKTEEGSELILTEASRKQLLKDREKYNAMLFAEANMAAEKTQKKDSDAERRRQLMNLLAGPQEAHRRAQPWYREPKQEKQKKSENKLPEPMLKIKVWRDDENAPVQTLPDVVQDML